jgi:hypothetical protein
LVLQLMVVLVTAPVLVLVPSVLDHELFPAAL